MEFFTFATPKAGPLPILFFFISLAIFYLSFFFLLDFQVLNSTKSLKDKRLGEGLCMWYWLKFLPLERAILLWIRFFFFQNERNFSLI